MQLVPQSYIKTGSPIFLKGKADGSTHKSQEKAVSFCCQISKICSNPFSPKTPSLME